jgi:hypothetical protein
MAGLTTDARVTVLHTSVNTTHYPDQSTEVWDRSASAWVTCQHFDESSFGPLIEGLAVEQRKPQGGENEAFCARAGFNFRPQPRVHPPGICRQLSGGALPRMTLNTYTILCTPDLVMPTRQLGAA